MNYSQNLFTEIIKIISVMHPDFNELKWHGLMLTIGISNESFDSLMKNRDSSDDSISLPNICSPEAGYTA